jgi:hypothetical protein
LLVSINFVSAQKLGPFLDSISGSGINHKNEFSQGLRTPNEGINQKNLKIWTDVADKFFFGRTKKFGSGGADFRPCSEGDFLTGGP